MIQWHIDLRGLLEAERRYADAERIYREEMARSEPEVSRILVTETERAAPRGKSERIGKRLHESFVGIIEPIPNGSRITVESRDVPHVRWVVEGTRPHDILPRFKKALRFTAVGRVFIRKKVRHPGTKPNPFFDVAREKARPKVRRVYQATNRRILLRLISGH